MSKSTFNKGIIIPSLLFIIGVCLLAVFFPTLTVSILDTIKQFIFVNLNWVYVWAVTLFVIFLVYLMFSKFGNIKLGSNDSKARIYLLFLDFYVICCRYGNRIDVFQCRRADATFFRPRLLPVITILTEPKMRSCILFFIGGMHAWAIYGVVGLALSYFAYRYRLPLSLRSCFYPLLKNKINGKWGNAIDVFALCSTFFGITTTLGFGVVQVNAGLQTLGLVPDNNFTYQIMIVGVLTLLAVLSATSGVDKGVKILSNINILTVIILLLFVLFLGPTVYLIGSFTEGIGNYVNNFFSLTFDTHVYDEATLPWFYNWTILYWAWWISWSPYVGLFIAKISKGRTIREFIAAVLIIPTIFNFIWMSVFGNSAMWFDINIAKGALSSLADNPDALMFRFLDYLPLSEIVSYLVILIIIIFFVTSADSGIFVMNSIATKNAPKSPKWQMVFWGALLAILALMLLNTGGLQALQTMTLITALPFSIIMLLFCVSLVKALTIDRSYYERDFSVSTVPWSGEFWKDRLQQIVSFKSRESVDEFMRSTVKAAFEDLQAEFKENGIESKIHELDKPNRIAIEIRHDLINNFIYGVKNHFKVVSDYVVEEENLPDIADKKTYFPKSYFGDAREGYDIQYFTKNELISDVLKHYERFLEIISEEKNEMFISSNANKNLR
ncbi:Glycine betaine transporter BetP [Sphingobacterium multivorum]|uniref:Glycine betaine transporter BetP n=1 Tax=Sphingobacterium multivorum TaxID=28454 RepID=A0A2X2IWI0_SPHMU|nr:Glycine betaine transporter BetP [Sphingobacterium multivorum]